MPSFLFEQVKALIQMLSVTRANDYEMWREVGLCLHNITSESIMLENWKEFTRKSVSFKEEDCENMWPHLGFENDSEISLLTLNRWAQIDNFANYYVLIKNNYQDIQKDAIRLQTSQDVARTVVSLYKYKFICASIRDQIWYEFGRTSPSNNLQKVNNPSHRWFQNESVLYSIREKIGTEIVEEYLRRVTYYNRLLLNDLSPEIKKKYIDMIENINDVILKLKTSKFVDNVMKECEAFFYDPLFEGRLNTRRDLIGFENGIYDLRLSKLRPGRQEDYITLSTGNDYIEFSPNHDSINAIDLFMSQLFVDKDLRDYVYILLASFLDGHNPHEKFHIFRGDGSNGRATLMQLFELAFGQYVTILAGSFITQKQKRSGLVEFEASRLKNTRLLAIQTNSNKIERLNVTLLKEWTGGDRISGVRSNGTTIEYKPQFKMVYLCRYWPRLPSDDEGVWRRISLVEFDSRFVENPDPHNPYEIKKDPHINLKLSALKEAFMFILLEKYKIYKIQGLNEPATVINATKEYRQDLKICSND